MLSASSCSVEGKSRLSFSNTLKSRFAPASRGVLRLWILIHKYVNSKILDYKLQNILSAKFTLHSKCCISKVNVE